MQTTNGSVSVKGSNQTLNQHYKIASELRMKQWILMQCNSHNASYTVSTSIKALWNEERQM